MAHKKIVTAVNNQKTEQPKQDKVSLESQERLAEILNDSPHIISLNGTEWAIRALRMGTQWLIAEKVIKIKKSDNNTFGDVIAQFAKNEPAIIEVITLALLNDKNKIYEDGDEKKGFSSLYHATKDTLQWECNVSEFGNLLFEILQMVQIDFFYQTLSVVDIFRANVTERKTTMMKTIDQK